ncbi:hypothetical protein bcgnr5378_30060 [Bacillus cereus]|uniref:Conjugal transfer protein n=1 Tax=Bacillus cereus TaxID=1396 RepID=A0A164QS65_BACCE|nr:hypothetical protein [Bacillus cereus]KZD72107.1 hypothetical protein B4088_0568 [Bacillus cereus]
MKRVFILIAMVFTLILPIVTSTIPHQVFAEDKAAEGGGDKKEDKKEEKKTEKKPSSKNVGMVEADKYPGYKIIGYEGLITSTYIRKMECVDTEKKEGEKKEGEKAPDNDYAVGQGKKAKSEESGFFSKYIGEVVLDLVGSAIDFFFKPNCKDADDSFVMNIGKEMGKLGEPVNVTNNYIVMKLTGIMQYLAYGLSVIFTVIYGILYMLEKSEISPIKFFMRLGFVAAGIYFAPYVLQDILNLNNILVYNISQISVTFDGGKETVVTAIPQAIYGFMSGTKEVINGNLLVGIVMLLMIIYALKPLFDIAMWWYTRLFKIFFYTVVSPLLIMLMALPQTSGNAKKALKDFIGETFAQFFVVLGMGMISMILVNILDMKYIIDLSDVGTMIFIFVALNFMADLPRMAQNIVGGISGGGQTSTGGLMKFATAVATMKAAKDINKIAKNTAGTVKSAGRSVNNGVKNTFAAPSKMKEMKNAVGEKINRGKEAAMYNRTSAAKESGDRQGWGIRDGFKENGLVGGMAAMASNGLGGMMVAAGDAKERIKTGVEMKKLFGEDVKNNIVDKSVQKAGVQDIMQRYRDSKYFAHGMKQERKAGEGDMKKLRVDNAMEKKRAELSRSVSKYPDSLGDDFRNEFAQKQSINKEKMEKQQNIAKNKAESMRLSQGMSNEQRTQQLGQIKQFEKGNSEVNQMQRFMDTGSTTKKDGGNNSGSKPTNGANKNNNKQNNAWDQKGSGQQNYQKKTQSGVAENLKNNGSTDMKPIVTGTPQAKEKAPDTVTEKSNGGSNKKNRSTGKRKKEVVKKTEDKIEPKETNSGPKLEPITKPTIEHL